MQLIFLYVPEFAQHLLQPQFEARRDGRRPREAAGHGDGRPVGLDVGAAVGALGDVLFDREPGLGGELAADELVEHGMELAAGHAPASSKCGARASRILSRARCSRLFTAGTDRLSISPISWFGSPSTSAST